MNAFFGEPWDAPATDGQPRVATPVGQKCLWCSMPIVEGDRGFIVPAMRQTPAGDWYADPLPQHRECQLRSVVGSPAHLDGHCSCHGGNPARPQTPEELRAEAIEVWDRINSGRF